jgi:hypothetical protein
MSDQPAKTVKEVLIAAKWMLENVGWCQKTFRKYSTSGESPSCAFCSFGAIINVNYGSPGLIDKALAVLSKSIDTASGSITIWNDDPKRTKSQVLAVFDKAIASVQE